MADSQKYSLSALGQQRDLIVRLAREAGIMPPPQMQDNDPTAPEWDWRNYDYGTPTYHPGGQIPLVGKRSDMPSYDPYDRPEGDQRWLPQRGYRT